MVTIVENPSAQSKEASLKHSSEKITRTTNPNLALACYSIMFSEVLTTAHYFAFLSIRGTEATNQTLVLLVSMLDGTCVHFLPVGACYAIPLRAGI